jgi:cytoskeleton protein RodZ
MSEEVVEVPGQEQHSTAGQLLIEAREAQSLSAADLARQLRLALRQVEALEQNAFEQLPGKTFVRGFIRNYAKMLGVDPDPILEAYERQCPEPASQPVSSPREHITLSQRPSRKWIWYLGGFVIVFIVIPLIIYGLLQGGEHRPGVVKQDRVSVPVPLAPAPATTVQSAPVVPPVSEVSPAQVVPPAPVVQPPQGALPSTASAAPPIASATVPPVATGPAQPGTAVSKGLNKIQLKFSGDSWVEIRDGNGKRIFSQLNLAGSQQIVEGKPPFQAVVGNASAVTVIYNGKMIDLHPYTAVNVARFTLQ